MYFINTYFPFLNSRASLLWISLPQLGCSIIDTKDFLRPDNICSDIEFSLHLNVASPSVVRRLLDVIFSAFFCPSVCVSENLVLSTEFAMLGSHRMKIVKADLSSVSPSIRSNEGLMLEMSVAAPQFP